MIKSQLIRKIKIKWEEGFSEQISDTVNNIIFQNTKFVSRYGNVLTNCFKWIKGFSGTNNEIIILSDMIQNTDGISMYQNNLPSFSTFKKWIFFKVKTNL